MAQQHKLALYEAAVQHPAAAVALLQRMYAHHHDHAWPALLREDFAGSAAVSRAWVLNDEDNQAMAVELHAPTLRWAARQAKRAMGERFDDLHLVHADVMELASPKVDVVAAMNFSTFIYHTRETMLRYLKHARRCLRPGGLLVLDAFGGPGAMRCGEQSREVTLADSEVVTYIWEQRSFDALTHRIDCRIHFRHPDGRTRASAFRYDWRLWSLAELRELMTMAGFAEVVVWCDRYDAGLGPGDGAYEPVSTLPAREDFLAYVVGLR